MNTLALDLAQVLRGFFLLATIAALSVNAIPALRQGFLLYGSRQTDFAATSKVNDRSRVKQKALLDIAAQLQVPHSWFIHFYISSVASSIFWGYQIATNGAVLAYIISLSANSGFATSSMTFNQVVITWTFMTLQGCRRLLECLTLVKPSKAQMPILSWLLGIAFYISVGLSIWIEGIRTWSKNCNSIPKLIVLSHPFSHQTFHHQLGLLQTIDQDLDCCSPVCLCVWSSTRLSWTSRKS